MGASTDNQHDLHTTKTLYERLGGDSFMNMLVCSFYDELIEDPEVQPFFKNISVSALKLHQIKLFRVVFGIDEEQPEVGDLLEFILRAHTRLFRELGLDETHFDIVIKCFVQGLESLQVNQELIEEAAGALTPLRMVFEYGAKVAAQEKTMDPEQLKSLPLASAKTIGTDIPAVLPEYSKIEIPDWLPSALGKHSVRFSTVDESIVRAWTCELTNRFGAEGDSVIADTFMDQPYMDHHVYLVAFLKLAFLPEGCDAETRQDALDIVLYPRGRSKEPLSRKLFDRMIVQFQMTCQMMGMPPHVAQRAEDKLRTYRSAFASKTHTVGGINAPHILSKSRKMEACQNKRTKHPKKKAPKQKSHLPQAPRSSKVLVGGSYVEDNNDSDTVCSDAVSCISASTSSDHGSKFSWFSLFGHRSSKKGAQKPNMIAVQ